MLRIMKTAFAAINPFCLPDLDPVSRFAGSGWAQAATPDELIAARVMELIVRDFEGWSHQSGTIPEVRRKVSAHHCRDVRDDFRIRHEAENIVVSCSIIVHRQVRGQYPADIYKVTFECLIVNGVRLTEGLADKVVKTYLDIKGGLAEAKRVAAEALAEMQANEKKWNLAEELLNMTRNSDGALVPKTPVIVAPVEPEVVTSRPKPRRKMDNVFDSAVS